MRREQARQRQIKRRERKSSRNNNEPVTQTLRDDAVTERDASFPHFPPSDGFPDPSLTPPYNPPTKSFGEFWDAYPKQRAGSRAKAAGAYSIALKKASHEEIMLGVRAYARSH